MRHFEMNERIDPNWFGIKSKIGWLVVKQYNACSLEVTCKSITEEFLQIAPTADKRLFFTLLLVKSSILKMNSSISSNLKSWSNSKDNTQSKGKSIFSTTSDVMKLQSDLFT